MMPYEDQKLAIQEGIPVRKKPWPKWPYPSPKSIQYLNTALHSGRWAISGAYTGNMCFERQFSQAFATYTGAKHCVPTTSGTAALTMALLALKIGPGDEVLVPGLTWVACASSVIAVGAIPILVDINLDDLCMSAKKAKEAISPACKAIMLVHLFNSVASLDKFIILAAEKKIFIIEDCAQAHGARWENKHVGTFGEIGCFSMQQSKLLTSGEGGAVITNDTSLYNLLEQIRSDGRMFLSRPSVGKLELEEKGEIQGHNLCLSEFQAAVLLGELETLEESNIKRRKNADYLTTLLSDLSIKTYFPNPKVTHSTYYNYIVSLNLEEFSNVTIDSIARALSAELLTTVNTIYKPLNAHPLYCPLLSPRISKDHKTREYLNPIRFDLPNATKARNTCLSFHHSLFLDNEEGMENIALAIKKVRKNSKFLPLIDQNPSSISF